MAYTFVVIRRTRRQTRYRPVLEDWAWHAGIPLVAYVALLITALGLGASPVLFLFVVAASALLLLFVGIHNAWDTVTFIAVERMRVEGQQSGAEDGRPDRDATS
jgi:ABC-type proline/glycine betaine transport system permease subunit